MATRRTTANGTEPAKIVVPEPPPPDDLPVGLDNRGDDEHERGVADDLGDLFALSDESYRDVVWYVWRRRIAGEVVDRRSNPNAPIYVAKVVGPIDLDDLAKLIGGGSFRLCGFRAGRKIIERPIEVDGPKKSHAIDLAAGPAPAAATPPADVAQVVAAAVERVLERIEQRMSANTPPNNNGGMTFKDAIEMAKLMRGEPQGSPDAALVQSYVGILKEGIALGTQRENPTGTDWGAVVEKSLPLLEKMIGGILTRRPVPVRRAAPPAPGQRPPSHAEVVQDQPQPPADESVGESVRMSAVVDSLARAVEAMGTENEIEPADFAVTVETILDPGELSMLRLTTTDGLMAELARVSERFPSLVTPQARVFVDAVLTALRTPPDAE